MTREQIINELVQDDINTIMESAIDGDYKYLTDILTSKVKSYEDTSDRDIKADFEDREI